MKKKRFKSIQSIIAFFYSSLFIITFAVTGFIAYYLTEDVAKKNAMNYTLELIEKINRDIQSYIEYMKNISSIVINNKYVLNYYHDFSTLNATDRRQYKDNISSILRSILQARKDINLILLVGYMGDFISNRDNSTIKTHININQREWYVQASKEGGDTVISSAHVQDILKDEYRWVVSMSQEFSSKEAEKPLGILLVDLNLNIIENLCKEIYRGSRSYIFIVDYQGRIVYHPQHSLIYSDLKTEMINQVITSSQNSFVVNQGADSRIYTIKTLEDPKWKICSVTYINELVTDENLIQLYYFLLGLACITVVIIISIFISKKISRPIKNLQSLMHKVESGNFDIAVKVRSTNEIGELEKDFSIMIQKIKELIIQNQEKQKLLRKSEFMVLQAQINPHFLYNTLETIICLAKNPDNVVHITAALAKLLRIGISKGKNVITVEQEVEHVRNYLIIQKIRYQDKFNYTIDIDPDILNMQTIKIILQPLAENAIYHGIKMKHSMGHIRIKGIKNGSNILLQVIDDGVGMSRERIEEVFKGDYSDFSKSGIGISNVNERIKLFFGNQYGLVCNSREGQGTTIDITIPQVNRKLL